MRHQEYLDACERSERKDRPARLRNLAPGGIGTVMQCTGRDSPEAFRVKVGEDAANWNPDEAEEDV